MIWFGIIICSFTFPKETTSFLVSSYSHSQGVTTRTLPQSTVRKAVESKDFHAFSQQQSYHHYDKKTMSSYILRRSNTELRDCTKSYLFASPYSNNRKLHENNEQVLKQSKRKAATKKAMQRLPLPQIRRPLGLFITRIFKFIIVSIAFFVMKILNRTYLHDPNNNLEKYCFDRNDEDVGLLTISNHCSIMDDPGIWAGTLPLQKLTLNNMRNIVMVEESYYQLGRLSASILHGLNCLPIRRDDVRGLQSPQLYELQKRLNGISSKREWCHIMVEGRIYQPSRFELPHGNSLPQLGQFRLDAAKLIATSPPSKTVVLPIYHWGMHNIFPETLPEGTYTMSKSEFVKPTRIPGKTKLQFPGWGKRIDVYVGDPIDFTDIVPKDTLLFEKSDYKDLLNEINAKLYDAMLKLEFLASQGRI